MHYLKEQTEQNRLFKPFVLALNVCREPPTLDLFVDPRAPPGTAQSLIYSQEVRQQRRIPPVQFFLFLLLGST